MVAVSPAAIVPESRRERRRHEVRARIIEAAMQLFDAKGFTAATVAEICAAADVAEKTFFNQFTSKLDMLREVARVELDLLLELIAEAGRRGGSAGDARGRVEAFFRLLADRVANAGPMRRELLTELVHLAHDAGTGSVQARTLQGAFAELLRTGPPGARRPANETAVEVVLGAFYALMLNWANIEDYPVRRRALAMARFLGDAITDAGRRRR